MNAKQFINSIKSKSFFKIASIITILLIIVFIGLLSYRLISGKSLGLRSFVSDKIYRVKNLGQAVLDSPSVRSDSQDFKNIIFLHHSTGSNLIRDGKLREVFRNEGYELWDHGYNEQGLRMPDGTSAGYNYNIPGDNTNPGGFNRIFSQTEYPIPINAYSGLLQHDVIIFKSCFTPANHITSDEQLEQYKTWYLAIRDEIDQHPEKIFIIVTPPPLNPAETNQGEAIRARAFADWLKSDEYLSGHPNAFTFDFFDYLAESDPESPDHNRLKKQYRIQTDSHPNQIANETIAPIFAEFIISATETYTNQLQP